MVGRIGAMAATCTTWVNTPELYPTYARGTGHSLANAWNRIASALTPLPVTLLKEFVAGIVIALFSLVGAISSWTLPKETTGKDLNDDDED